MDAYRFVVEVANLLRERQLKVGVSESLDACQALCFVSSYGLPEIKTAIKVTMLKDPSKFHLLEEVFQRAVADASSESEGGEEGDQTGEGRERGTQSYSAARAAQDQNRGQQQDKTVDVYMYSPMETLHRRALKPIDPLRVRTGRRVIRRMKRRLALLEGRRYRRSTRGELDFPKTMKSALGDCRGADGAQEVQQDTREVEGRCVLRHQRFDGHLHRVDRTCDVPRQEALETC